MWARANHPSKPFLICETGAGALIEWSDGEKLPRPLLPSTYVTHSKLLRDHPYLPGVKLAVESAGTRGLWSMTYQRKLLTSIVSLAFASADIAGFSLWQLTDIKTDDDKVLACGSCKYTAATAKAPIHVPHDCAAYSSACNFPFATSRPAGSNHKGIVDYWRRPKEAFYELAKLFKAEQLREQNKP